MFPAESRRPSNALPLTQEVFFAMQNVQNPYEAPGTAIDWGTAPSQGVALWSRVIAAILIRVVFRFLGALTSVFLILIDTKGLGVNWSNAVPLITVFLLGCIASHFILNLRSTSARLESMTGIPLYLAGVIAAIFIVISEVHPRGF